MGCGASKVDEVHTTAPSDRIVAAPVKNVEVKSDVQPKIKATVEDTSNAESRTATDTDTPQPAMTSDAAALVETKALEGEAEDTFANTSQQQQQAETTVVEEESSAETPNEAATQPATRSGWDGYSKAFRVF